MDLPSREIARKFACLVAISDNAIYLPYPLTL